MVGQIHVLLFSSNIFIFTCKYYLLKYSSILNNTKKQTNKQQQQQQQKKKPPTRPIYNLWVKTFILL
jgi:membrane-anchored glycerophosphoryl diester phosphodiesterase (GDPDase)